MTSKKVLGNNQRKNEKSWQCQDFSNHNQSFYIIKEI